MSRTKKILLAILIVFIVMQFIRPAKNSSSSVQQADMITQFNVPANVAGILKKSCYDCHSNNTQYPWYANIQLVGWLLAQHVEDGKEELNFNEFTGYSQRRQLSKLKAIGNSVKDGTMPLSSYTFIHADAKLLNGQKQLIIKWALQTADSIEQNQSN